MLDAHEVHEARTERTIPAAVRKGAAASMRLRKMQGSADSIKRKTDGCVELGVKTESCPSGGGRGSRCVGGLAVALYSGAGIELLGCRILGLMNRSHSVDRPDDPSRCRCLDPWGKMQGRTGVL